MTRPTTTRAELRRSIAMRLMMPFARRVSNGYAASTGWTSYSMSDTSNLRQVHSNYWSGQWVYFPEEDEVRQILSSNSSGVLDVEYPFSWAYTIGDTYEIHSIFNAHEIHQAINDAINSSYPSFFETVEDASLVVLESKTEYALTSITPSVGVIHEVALERPTTRMYGTIESYANGVGSSVLTLEDTVDLSEVDSSWYFSIYDGTGEGIVYPVVSADNTAHTVTISGYDLSPAPVNGDKYLLWDAREQELDWYRLKFVHFSSKEWPSTMRLYAPIWDYRGSRLRIKYSTMPSALTSETSTTVVPKQYIIAKAIALLAESRIGDNRVDRQRYAIMQELYTKEAELYKNQNFFRLPDAEMFMEGRDYSNMGDLDPQGDPLGWRR